MDFDQHLVFPIKNTLLLGYLLFCLASTFIQDPFFTQGLPITHHYQALQEKALIGSRPPRCAGRCINCGHCEAIQVPVVPQQAFPISHFVHATPTMSYSRDGLSNYMPISWKCKCGSYIFYP